MLVVSMRTPGPIVDDSVTVRRYLPFAAAGFALTMLSTSACAFAIRLVGGNDALPTGAWMMPVLSTRNSTLPALISWTALAMSVVTVPVFGFGIRPRGPSTLPSLPTARIMSGVATTASKSMKPPWIFSTISSPPTKSAPAAWASFCFSPPAIARTRLLLPRPCGRTMVPRTIWSACFGSTPSRSDISTVSSNFANFTFCTSGTASSILQLRSGGTAPRAPVNFVPRCRIDSPRGSRGPLRGPPTPRAGRNVELRIWNVECDEPAHDFQVPNPKFPHRLSSDHVQPHRPRSAGHGLDGRFERVAVEIGHLQLGDLLDLLGGHGADLVLVRLRRSLRDVRGALQQHRRGRRFGDEAVGPIRIHGDDDRDDQAFILRRPRVEVLAEVHDVHALRTERGPHRRRRRRLAGRNLELHHRLNFFRHRSRLTAENAEHAEIIVLRGLRALGGQIFSTCKKSNSTGVERPKIVTITFNVFFSRFTSSTTPVKLANGPSLMRTCSPLSNMYFGFGFSAAVFT